MSETQFDLIGEICLFMQFYVAWLNWPVSLITLIVIGHRCYQKNIFQEALPLLASQLNSAIIWGCMATYQIGFFYHDTTGNQIMKGKPLGLRKCIVETVLTNIIYLGPLDIFLYAWRFIDQLK